MCCLIQFMLWLGREDGGVKRGGVTGTSYIASDSLSLCMT